jgi:hypothetical protein
MRPMSVMIAKNPASEVNKLLAFPGGRPHRSSMNLTVLELKKPAPKFI